MHYLKNFLVLLLLTVVTVRAQKATAVEFLSNFKLSGVSIRAIEVTDENSLWFAGSGGHYGRIVNEKLELDSISHEGKHPHFRSIASNGAYIFLLSIEDPALLYKIDPSKPLGEHELVYKESNAKVFYDSLTFFDKDHGIGMGDPTEGCLSVITTSDGGNSWNKISCEKLPEINEGEAAFAASNSNIATYGEKAWLVTGGSKARVFISADFDKNWQVIESPLVQGGKMTGIFTVDFYDEMQGILMGGNWEDKKDGIASKALTKDGGLTWDLVAENGAPGYISCVRYLPKSGGQKIMAVSTEGMFYSEDGGMSWDKIEDKGYYSLRFIDEQTAWVSTHEEITKIKLK